MRKQTLVAWILLLSIALISSQGLSLHVHSFGSDHESHDNIAPEMAAEHSHQSEIHLTKKVSHFDHHDEVISELNTSSQILLKKVSSNSIFLAILMIVVTLLVYHGYMQGVIFRRDDNCANLVQRYLLSPPLRAPPV